MLLSSVVAVKLTLEHTRLLWLATSVVLYVVARNVVWVLRPVIQRVNWSPSATLVPGVLRFGFYVGMPYLALLRGVVTLPSLGVVEVEHPESLGAGVLVMIGAVVLMGLIGRQYHQANIATGDNAGLPLQAVRQVLSRPWGWVLLLTTVAYQQAHWAFYRALPALILDDRYVGSFAGLALVMLEAYADPQVREDLTDPVRAEFLLLSAGVAVVATLLFTLTGTSLLGAAMHLLFLALVMGWVLLAKSRQTLQPHTDPDLSTR